MNSSFTNVSLNLERLEIILECVLLTNTEELNIRVRNMIQSLN